MGEGWGGGDLSGEGSPVGTTTPTRRLPPPTSPIQGEVDCARRPAVLTSPAMTDPQGLAARRAALDAITAVFDRHQPLDTAFARLDARDRAFARQLATTTIRHAHGLDAAVDRFLDRPLPKRAGRVRHILRLGLAQVLLLGVADHAAVDSAVRLTAASRQAGDRALKGLVNAVLRRAIRERDDLKPALAAEQNLPDWIRQRWQAAYGAATTGAIARTLAEDPPLDLTPRTADDAATLAEALAAQRLPTGSLRLARAGEVTALAGFAEGRWWVQDAAAALPARLLGDVAGRTVVDLCAAPGGKTLQLAAAGARVIAVDRSAKRLERLEENLRRTGLDARVVTADALAWHPDGPIDHILLDAPCSATGTARRHPDVLHIKSDQDIASLADLQARLLDHAVSLLPAGGTLVYCVCSLEPEEGCDQIAALLDRRPALRRQPVDAGDLPGLAEAVTPAGDVRTLPCFWPDNGGLDGFYIARLTLTS